MLVCVANVMMCVYVCLCVVWTTCVHSIIWGVFVVCFWFAYGVYYIYIKCVVACVTTSVHFICSHITATAHKYALVFHHPKWRNALALTFIDAHTHTRTHREAIARIITRTYTQHACALNRAAFAVALPHTEIAPLRALMIQVNAHSFPSSSTPSTINGHNPFERTSAHSRELLRIAAHIQTHTHTRTRTHCDNYTHLHITPAFTAATHSAVVLQHPPVCIRNHTHTHTHAYRGRIRLFNQASHACRFAALQCRRCCHPQNHPRTREARKTNRER